MFGAGTDSRHSEERSEVSSIESWTRVLDRARELAGPGRVLSASDVDEFTRLVEQVPSPFQIPERGWFNKRVHRAKTKTD